MSNLNLPQNIKKFPLTIFHRIIFFLHFIQAHTHECIVRMWWRKRNFQFSFAHWFFAGVGRKKRGWHYILTCDYRFESIKKIEIEFSLAVLLIPFLFLKMKNESKIHHELLLFVAASKATLVETRKHIFPKKILHCVCCEMNYCENLWMEENMRMSDIESSMFFKSEKREFCDTNW